MKLAAPTTLSKVSTATVGLSDDIIKYYKDNGLDSLAKEVSFAKEVSCLFLSCMFVCLCEESLCVRLNT